VPAKTTTDTFHMYTLYWRSYEIYNLTCSRRMGVLLANCVEFSFLLKQYRKLKCITWLHCSDYKRYTVKCFGSYLSGYAVPTKTSTNTFQMNTWHWQRYDIGNLVWIVVWCQLLFTCSINKYCCRFSCSCFTEILPVYINSVITDILFLL